MYVIATFGTATNVNIPVVSWDLGQITKSQCCNRHYPVPIKSKAKEEQSQRSREIQWKHAHQTVFWFEYSVSLSAHSVEPFVNCISAQKHSHCCTDQCRYACQPSRGYWKMIRWTWQSNSKNENHREELTLANLERVIPHWEQCRNLVLPKVMQDISIPLQYDEHFQSMTILHCNRQWNLTVQRMSSIQSWIDVASRIPGWNLSLARWKSSGLGWKEREKRPF